MISGLSRLPRTTCLYIYPDDAYLYPTQSFQSLRFCLNSPDGEAGGDIARIDHFGFSELQERPIMGGALLYCPNEASSASA